MPLPSATVDDHAHSDWRKTRASHLRTPPAPRPPDWLDGVLFFLVLPAGIAFIFSLVGIRLINGMPYWQGFTYMLVHMAIAWWSVSIGSSLVKLGFRSWRPPVIAICTLGFFLSLIPAGFMFKSLGDFYSAISPIFAANRADAAMPSWDIDYLVHFIRYSIPALPLYLAGVFGYRFVTGVKWFGYPAKPEAAPTAAAEAPSPPPPQKAVAGRIIGTRLAPDAILLAVKAEQHYIKIWSDKGTDLVRYRFKDLENVLTSCNAIQVHRSWWVNLDQVSGYQTTDRKLELVINDKLAVPVSTSYKQVVFARLGKRIAPPPED